MPMVTRLLVEPFRANAFPIVRDLKIDRSALDRIQQAGGFISTNIRTAPEANSILIARQAAEAAFGAAACIGCGACVASCKNAAASLFTAAKVSHLSHLPQGKIEGAQSRREHGAGDGFRRIRQLLQHGSLRGGLSAGNHDRSNCPHELGVHLGASQDHRPADLMRR